MTEYALEQKQLVIDIIQEYLDENRVINAVELINFINSRLVKASINVSTRGIKEILKSLFKKNLIVEKSKFFKTEVLNNPNRRNIYDCIKEHPGFHFNKLAKNLNLSVAVLDWHLNILLKFKCIIKKKIENHDAYFHSNIDLKYTEALHLLTREKYKKIINFLEININTGFSKTHLSKLLKIHRNTITKYVEKLYQLGLILKEKSSNRTLFSLNMKVYKNLKQI